MKTQKCRCYQSYDIDRLSMKNKGKKCLVKSCDKSAVCKELCTKHYQQKKLRGSIIEKDYVFIEGLCQIVGCGKKVLAKGYCQNHYLENRKEGL